MTISPNDWTGTDLANGRYLITDKLGEGGMGVVYRARDRNIDADVVIKVPLRSMVTDPEFSRRFKDEIRSLVKLSHPHIVKISDVGDQDGLPFAVMQFLPGGSLEDRREAGLSGATNPRDAVGWLGGTAGALDYVHSQGYIHRDVKPGNILFDAQGHPFLSDFGVVKVLASAGHGGSSRAAMTGTGMVLGTPEYMAPELIMGDPLDGRVDQYALAVTVYEMLCGRRPFEDEVKTKVLVLHTSKAPAAPVDLCPWLPPRLSEAVLKGLAKDPAERYPNCVSLAAAVASAVDAMPAGPPDRVRFKCPSCGKTLGMSPQDFQKLRQTGRRARCSGCNTPIELAGVVGGLSVTPPGVRRGDTLVASLTGSLREVPAAPGGGTLAFSPNDPSGGQAAPRRSSQTVVERPAAVAAKTLAFEGVTVPTPADAGTGPRPDDEGKPGLSRSVWLGAGVSAAAAVVIVAVGFWRFAPGRQTQTIAAAQSVTPTPASTALVKAAPPPAVPAAVDHETRGATTVAVRDVEPGVGALGSPPPAETPAEAGAVAVRPAGTTKPDPGPAKPPTPAPTPVALPEPSRVPDRIRPADQNVPLKKILADPTSYVGRFVMLERLYVIGRVASRRSDGMVSLSAVETSVTVKNDAIHVRLGDAAEFLVHPKLAERLISVGKLVEIADAPPSPGAWDTAPANLTVRVDPRGKAGGSARDLVPEIVDFEYFDGFEREAAAVGYRTKLKVHYRTTCIGPNGERPGLGNPEVWSKTMKLGHVYQFFQRVFESNRRSIKEAEWAAKSRQLDSIIDSGMRDSIRNQMQTEQMLRDKLRVR